MRSKINYYKKRFRDKTREHAQGRKGSFWLALVSFAEASIFPIPPDVVLAWLVIDGKRSYWYYAAIATAWSVIGGLAGYAIGAAFFDLIGERIIELYSLSDEVATVRTLFSDNAFLTMFISAFTPIPYKVFTISAGLFGIQIIPFVLASIAGRWLRFWAVGYLTDRFGRKMLDTGSRYFNLATIIVAAIVIAIVWMLY